MKKKSDRGKSIVDYLLTTGPMRVDDLADHFGVSRMTIHRDVTDLVDRGIVRRDHGIVTMHSSMYYESNYWYRSALNKTAKQSLAKAAARIIGQYNIVLIDDSTTSLEILTEIPLDESKVIISNSAAALSIVENTKATFIQLGGSYNRIYNSYLGVLCESTLRTVTADVAYMSSSSLDEDSIYHQDENVVRVKQEILKSARVKILAVDESKFRQKALFRVCPLRSFDHIFCYMQHRDQTVQRMIDRGLPLTVVS